MVSSKTFGFYKHPSVSQMTSMRQLQICSSRDLPAPQSKAYWIWDFPLVSLILLTSSLTNSAFNHFRLITLFFLTFAPPAKRSQKTNIHIHSDPITTTKKNGGNEGLQQAHTRSQQVLLHSPPLFFFFAKPMVIGHWLLSCLIKGLLGFVSTYSRLAGPNESRAFPFSNLFHSHQVLGLQTGATTADLLIQTQVIMPAWLALYILSHLISPLLPFLI